MISENAGLSVHKTAREENVQCETICGKSFFFESYYG